MIRREFEYEHVIGAAFQIPHRLQSMPAPALPEPNSPERFRDYLLLIARGKIGPKYRAKIDAEAIVNQALFEAHHQRNQLRGCGESELGGWLRQVLINLVIDAIRF
jgi:signal transduction histidine kinase